MSIARKILIIDDQESIHDAFRKTLAGRENRNAELDSLESALFDTPIDADDIDHGFELDFAFQGQQGYEMVCEAKSRGTPYGLAFVDMRMPPGWDGVETIQKLWEVDPELQIVVCTAYSDRVWKDICNQLGKVDQLLLLNKPFASEYVLSLACALTEKRALMEQLRIELTRAQDSNKRLEREISNRKEVEKTLLEMATRDTLTGLPNRAVLLRKIREFQCSQKSNSERTGALLFLDIDNFKLVNDSLGHKAGDDLLMKIARRLTVHAESLTDLAHSFVPTVYRLGGDEFVVLLDGATDAKVAESYAAGINEKLKPVFIIMNRQFSIGASIGIAMMDNPDDDEDEILRKADTAMYRAKAEGNSRHAVFDEAMHQQVVEQLNIENGLRFALERNEFSLNYQPIIELATGKTIAFEALIRWRNSEGRSIPPDRFIHVAEQTGLIIPLGLWIAKRACFDFSQWKQRYSDTEGCSISINVSKIQLLEKNFANELLEICTSAGLKPSDLNIEVTETTVTDAYDDVFSALTNLRKIGFKIHMDDFGTGHSSLSFLHRYPIDVLKIDKSFVQTMTSDQENASIIDAIVMLAKNLGKTITAEGIEDQRQLNMLIELGCEHGQGYYFSKPAPASEAFSVRGYPYGSNCILSPAPVVPNALAH